MILTTRFCLLAVVFTVLTSAVDVRGSERQAMMPGSHAKLFKTNCYDCHDSGSEEAGVNLETISFNVSESMESAELWQKILNAINSGEMPPQESDQLPDEVKLRFLEDLTEQMVEARKILGDAGGAVPLRRLNRREYANTIESLLGVRPDVSLLPNDQVGSGFDTQGGSLFMSSDQIEQYLASARRALNLCITTRTKSAVTTRRVEPEDDYNESVRQYLAMLKENYKQSKAFQAQSKKPASAFGLIDPHQAEQQIKQYESWHQQLEQYLDRPETQHGVSLIMVIKKLGMTKVKLPTLRADRPGRYTVRLRAAMYPEAAERFHYLQFSSVKDRQRKHLGWRKVTAPLAEPQIIEFSFDHQPGEPLSLEIHQRKHQDRGDKALWTRAQRANGIGLPPGIWIDWAEVTGPEPAKALVSARQSLLLVPGKKLAGKKLADSGEKQYVQQVIERFAIRAFRGRVPKQNYLSQLYDHYLVRRDAGESMNEALIEPLAIILASPEFLYMLNDGRADEPERLTDRELAVRLSYLLWSQPPDSELVNVIMQGNLADPAVLQAQTQRLLADSKSENFVRDFTHQWLQMDRLGMFQFNGLRFPTFDDAVRESAREEIFQLVMTVLREGLPMRTLLESEFVVINDLLAGYYGIANVQGHEFRKVRLKPDSVRGGLLGTAAVAAMGSDGLRSSPVERGAWVLRHLLNDPPAPAPANVPQLSRLDGEIVSSRDLQRLHQEQPQCAQCHRKIDPIGFGLENFDVDGLWRDKERIITGPLREIAVEKTVSFDIEPQGKLPSGESFKNYQELRSLIASQDEAFARGFVESLIAYGMGRPYGFTDEPLAEAMMKAGQESGFAMKILIHKLVNSETFQSR